MDTNKSKSKSSTPGVVATATAGLGERLGSSVHEIAQHAKDMGETVKDAAQGALGDLRDVASETYRKGRTKVRNAQDTMEYGILTRPFVSVLIALGVGLAIGRLWPRR